ncbi:MAG: hypothetical protein FJ290_03900 [Planctomycetes bacterium]|nr:hypothetical protein [Planctomycetota bacterium]
MGKSKVIAIVTGGIVVAAIAFVVFIFVIKALWAWTVPDLFPMAVEQRLVAPTISWGAAAKVAVFLAILAGLGKGGHVHTSGREASKSE